MDGRFKWLTLGTCFISLGFEVMFTVGDHYSAHDNSRTSDVFRSILLRVRSILHVRMTGKNVRTAFCVTGNSGKAPVCQCSDR